MLCYICLLSTGKWAIYTITYINLRYFVWSDLMMQCYSFQHPIKVFILIIIVLTYPVLGMWFIWMWRRVLITVSSLVPSIPHTIESLQTENSHKFTVVPGEQRSTLKYVLCLFHKMSTTCGHILFIPQHMYCYQLVFSQG